MPDVVATIEIIAMAGVVIWSSVLAKRMAVPDIVAMASERRLGVVSLGLFLWRGWLDLRGGELC